MSEIVKGYTALKQADFTILYQGTTIITDTVNSVYMYQTGTGGITALSKPVPTAPYSFTAHINRLTGLGTEYSYGLCLRDSTSDKWSTFLVDTVAGGSATYVTTWSSHTTFLANQKALANGVYPVPKWLRIVDDGVNRLTYLSSDGTYWTSVYSEGRTTYLTPNQIGVCIVNWQAGSICCIIADHFKVDYSG